MRDTGSNAMNLRKEWIFTAVMLAFNILASSDVLATTIVLNNVDNIKKELFLSDGNSNLIWEELAFTFSLPDTASGDGLFRMFAGGDLNNLDIDRIDVTARPFP